MLTDEHTLMHLAKCRLTTEERKKDERFPVFGVGLVLEPLTYSQAKQLGAEVLGHCFSSQKHIHDGLTSVTVELDQPEQCVIAHMAVDVAEHARLRQVRIGSVTITKRDASEQGAETKSKKVGPQQPTLRATFHCLIDPAEKTHRDFLCGLFGKSLFFTFEPEQENLFTHLHTDEDDADDDGDQPELHLAPAPDAEAGDVLDEPPARGKKKGAPKLVKKHTNGSGKSAEV
jgi:hypothetical protein